MAEEKLFKELGVRETLQDLDTWSVRRQPRFKSVRAERTINRSF